MPVNKYDKIHRDLMNYILSGEIHSTLVGKAITLDSTTKANDIRSVEEFTEYVVSLLKKAESFSKKGKDNVKA